MALNQAYNVSGDLWIGPDSAKGNVSADSGRVYMAADTQVEYYGDGGSWIKLGVGSSNTPVDNVYASNAEVGSVNTEDIVGKPELLGTRSVIAGLLEDRQYLNKVKRSTVFAISELNDSEVEIEAISLADPDNLSRGPKLEIGEQYLEDASWSGEHLVISSNNPVIVDTRNPAAMSKTATINTSWDATGVDCQGGIALVTNNQDNATNVATYDISDPSNPTQLDEQDIFTGNPGDYYLKNGDFAIVPARLNDSWSFTLDLRDPTNVQLAGTDNGSPDSNSHNVTTIGDFGFVSESGGEVIAIDCRDPFNPTITDTLQTSVDLTHTIHRIGHSHVILADYDGSNNRGAVIVDVSDPFNIQEVQEYTFDSAITDSDATTKIGDISVHPEYAIFSHEDRNDNGGEALSIHKIASRKVQNLDVGTLQSQRHDVWRQFARRIDAGGIYADRLSAGTSSLKGIQMAGSPFVESGDVVSHGPVVTPVRNFETVSNASYQSQNGLGRGWIEPDGYDHPTGQLVWKMTGRLEAPAGETMSGQYYNLTDGEEIVSTQTASGATAGFDTGWVSYDPTTTASQIQIKYRHKTGGGSEGTSVQPRLFIGVQL